MRSYPPLRGIRIRFESRLSDNRDKAWDFYLKDPSKQWPAILSLEVPQNSIKEWPKILQNPRERKERKTERNVLLKPIPDPIPVRSCVENRIGPKKP